jgi:hypothetical protein
MICGIFFIGIKKVETASWYLNILMTFFVWKLVNGKIFSNLIRYYKMIREGRV